MKKILIFTIVLLIIASGLFGEWFERTFKDEFGDPTDSKYILNVMQGTFSNSAADDANAYISCIYRGDDLFEFVIFEYQLGNKAIFDETVFHTMYVKDDNGNKIAYRELLSMSKGSIMLQDDFLTEQIKKNRKLKMLIITNDTYTKYNFIMDCTGFSKALDYFK